MPHCLSTVAPPRVDLEEEPVAEEVVKEEAEEEPAGEKMAADYCLD